MECEKTIKKDKTAHSTPWSMKGKSLCEAEQMPSMQMQSTWQRKVVSLHRWALWQSVPGSHGAPGWQALELILGPQSHLKAETKTTENYNKIKQKRSFTLQPLTKRMDRSTCASNQHTMSEPSVLVAAAQRPVPHRPQLNAPALIDASINSSVGVSNLHMHV